MMSKKRLLWLTLVVFVLMALTGLVLIFKYQQSDEGLLLGVGRGIWLNIHIWSSVVMTVLIIIHLKEHWSWIVNVIFRKSTVGVKPKVRGRRRNDTWFFIVFLADAITGFTLWLINADCMLCKGLHDKLGLVLIGILITHLIKHRFPSRKHIIS